MLGLGPIPSFGVAGAGLATLISQSCRCLALIFVLYAGNKEVRWVWPLPGSRVAVMAAKLIQLTGPIAASEVLLGHEHIRLRDDFYPPGHHGTGSQPDRWKAFSLWLPRAWRPPQWP